MAVASRLLPTELLERIMGCVMSICEAEKPGRGILWCHFTGCRVSRNWYRTIKMSPTLQQAMFYKPVPSLSKTVVNPLLNHFVKHVITKKRFNEDTQNWQGMLVAHTAQARLVMRSVLVSSGSDITVFRTQDFQKDVQMATFLTTIKDISIFHTRHQIDADALVLHMVPRNPMLEGIWLDNLPAALRPSVPRPTTPIIQYEGGEIWPDLLASMMVVRRS